MIKELFKAQIVVTNITSEQITFCTRPVLPEKDLRKEAISELLADTKGYQFSSSDKLFFMPGCTVPRFKIKQLCNSIGMSVTKVPENATVIIKGDNTAKEIIRKEYISTALSTKDFLEWIEDNYPVGNVGTLAIKEELSKDNTFDKIIFSGVTVDRPIVLGESVPEYSWVKRTTQMDYYCQHVWVSDYKKLDDIDKILENNKTIVYQSELLAIINSSNVMTEEMYRETVKMFESKDTNNHVLAMELMANCDYQNSAVYLLALLKNYSSEIYNLKEKNHVNFRSLCSFFNIEPGESLTLDEIIGISIETNTVGTKELPTLMKICKEEMTNELSSDYLQVKDIEPNDSLNRAIQKVDQIRQAKLASKTIPPITEKTESNE